jgi:hypothetical protein
MRVRLAKSMPLSAGVRLGAYEIVSALGAGGMGACGHARGHGDPRRRISGSARRGCARDRS